MSSWPQKWKWKMKTCTSNPDCTAPLARIGQPVMIFATEWHSTYVCKDPRLEGGIAKCVDFESR